MTVVAVTHPPMSLVSLLNCWWDYVPIGIALGFSALNLLVWGPRTQEVMIDRIHQGEMKLYYFVFYRHRREDGFGKTLLATVATICKM